MKGYLLAITVAFLLSACTALKVVNVDPQTGYFPTSVKATVIKSKSIDLDAKKALILVPKPDFLEGQIRNIGYFDEVMSFETLENHIIEAHLTDKVPSITDRIGINNAAKNYKYFLWFRVDHTGTGNNMHSQFILTDPITMEDIFVADTPLDYLWTGVNDQHNWYPMFNALIDYIKANSKTYGKNASSH